MTFDALGALRGAGLLGGKQPEGVEEVFEGLSRDEVDFLVSLNSRIAAAVGPEVVAHSEDDEEDTPCLFAQYVGT